MRRQCAVPILGALLAVAVGSCSDPQIPVGTVGHVQKYFGGVAADEPRAVLIGRDVLSAGGSAADAVIAMSMAMMVTRPDAAGPGGGGVCVFYSAQENKAEALEFMPHASRTPPEGGRWIGTVPGTFRGLFALSARYGVLRWEQLVLPAENMARFGIPLPRSLARSLISDGASLFSDPVARQRFFAADGKPLSEGAPFRQLDLAGILGRIRVAGPGDFHEGHYLRQYVQAVRDAGGWITINDIRKYRPVWNDTVKLSAGNHILHFAPSPALGGIVAAGIWRDIGNSSRFSGNDDAGQVMLAMQASRRAHQAALSRPVSGRGSVGALSMDQAGNAAACVLTMGAPFGLGKVLGETGIIAVAPASADTALSLAPLVMANDKVKSAYAAATGAGDRSVGTALATVLARLLDGGQNIDEALRQYRYAPQAQNGHILLEEDAPPALPARLAGQGRMVTRVPSIGRINLMYCPQGMRERPEECAVRTDPRGFGHAINAEF